MLTLPICAVVAVPAACNSVGETYVVVTICPLIAATEFFTKPLPVRVSEKLPVVIDVGATEFRTGIGFCNVTELLPVCVASAVLVAVKVIVFGAGNAAGAVYIPFASIVPVVALPPATEPIDQVTLEFKPPFTTAANDSVDPTRIVTVAGVTVTPALPPSGNVGEPSLLRFVPSPEQPLSEKVRSTAYVQMRFTDVPPIRTRVGDTSPHARHTRCRFAVHFCFYKELGVATWVCRE
jgi:hypothetical protein